MNIQSNTVTVILKILLAAQIFLSASDLVINIVAWYYFSWYDEHLYAFYGFISSLSNLFYMISIPLFLTWIYTVHKDVNRMFMNYPISPGTSIVGLFMPLFNFYFMPKIFLAMGSAFLGNGSARTEGRALRWLALPLLAVILCSRFFNRQVSMSEAPELSLIVKAGVTVLAANCIYMAITWLVSRGITRNTRRQISQEVADIDTAAEQNNSVLTAP
ncbi:hypothetical protein [Paenibacillus gansuensis]|uniref:DUF4328 domain-containing protein n=1 Tax=Paenibacillus gansuensis TaxID=306542 RepID=A0ABW5PHM8_9BACL